MLENGAVGLAEAAAAANDVKPNSSGEHLEIYNIIDQKITVHRRSFISLIYSTRT